MNPLKALCVVAFLAAAVCGNQHQQQTLKLKPTQWLSPAQLKQSPAVDEVSVQNLENMSLEEGAKAMQTIYHVSQIDYDLKPSFVPSSSNIPVTIVKSNGQKVSTTLDKLATTAQQIPTFGQQEVTVFITGLPSSQSETVQKANQKLVQAYIERYNFLTSKSNDNNPMAGNLVIIDLGNQLSSSKRYAMLNVPETGEKIANQLVQLMERCKVPSEIINIVAQNIAAHVAGAAGQGFQRQTGRQINRITALDPSKVFAQDPDCLTGLSRGDAELVDAIHTSAWGMGTTARVGNVDFFPNGPSVGAAGARNVVEASMLATLYFAESVRPGYQYNFPAIESNSLENYKNKSGCGKRVYMGFALNKGSEGDYILQVNQQSPYGQKTPVQQQKNCHRSHKSSNWTTD